MAPDHGGVRRRPRLLRRLGLAAFAAAALLASTSHARAMCPNVVGGTKDLDAVDEAERLRFLRAHLDDQASKARLWTFGWLGAGAAATTFNGIWATTGTYSDRVDRLGSAAGTFMLTVTTAISPLSVPTEEGGGQYVDCLAVGHAERTLQAVAEDEVSRQSLVMHLLPIGGALATGAVLGFGYDHWTSAALGAGIGIAASELKMLTQPMGAERSLERYRRGDLSSDGPRVGWNLTPSIGKGGGGLALSVVF